MCVENKGDKEEVVEGRLPVEEDKEAGKPRVRCTGSCFCQSGSRDFFKFVFGGDQLSS